MTDRWLAEMWRRSNSARSLRILFCGLVLLVGVAGMWAERALAQNSAPNPFGHYVPPAVQNWVLQNQAPFGIYVAGNSSYPNGNPYQSSINSAPPAVKAWLSQQIAKGSTSQAGQDIIDLSRTLGAASQSAQAVRAAQSQLDQLAQQGFTDPDAFPTVAKAQAQLQAAQAAYTTYDQAFRDDLAYQQYLTGSIQQYLKDGNILKPPDFLGNQGGAADAMQAYLKSHSAADLQKLLNSGGTSKNIMGSGVDDGSGGDGTAATLAAIQAQLDRLKTQIAQNQPQSTGLNNLIASGTQFGSVQLQTIYTGSQLANYHGPSSAGVSGFDAAPWLSPSGTGVSSGGPALYGANLSNTDSGAALCGQ